MGGQLWRRTAREITALLRDGAVSAREVVDDHLDRIGAIDADINAVVTVAAEQARADATAVDAIRARGRELPSLAGLPMTIKDSFETAGLRTTSGAELYAEHVPVADAVAVKRLRAAGAVILGKTNLSTFAADLQSTNALFGTTNNPWDLGRTPGGSSGGAAAAVASGMSPVELGSDIGGSIRIPAAFCGVCGHKPTYGAVPTRGHIPGPPGTLSQSDIAVAGPLARTVDDLVLLFDVLAGPLEEDAAAWSLTLPPPVGTRPDQFRVGLWLDDPACPTERAQLEVLRGLAGALDDAGARLVDWTPPVSIERSRRLFTRLLQGALSAGWPDEVFARMVRLAEGAGDGPSEPMGQVAAAVAQRHADWLRADEERASLRAGWRRTFEQVDVVLTPANPFLAIPHLHEGAFHERTVEIDGQQRSYADQLVWAGLAGGPGLPATVVPAGLAKVDGGSLPVGVQIVGAPHADRTTLAFGLVIEELTGGMVWPPGYAS